MYFGSLISSCGATCQDTRDLWLNQPLQLSQRLTSTLCSPDFQRSSEQHIYLASIPMSFGFGIGDIVLVSGAVANLFTVIHDPPEDQQSLMVEVEMLRQLIAQFATDMTLVSPPDCHRVCRSGTAAPDGCYAAALPLLSAPPESRYDCYEVYQK